MGASKCEINTRTYVSAITTGYGCECVGFVRNVVFEVWPFYFLDFECVRPNIDRQTPHTILFMFLHTNPYSLSSLSIWCLFIEHSRRHTCVSGLITFFFVSFLFEFSVIFLLLLVCFEQCHSYVSLSIHHTYAQRQIIYY